MFNIFLTDRWLQRRLRSPWRSTKTMGEKKRPQPGTNHGQMLLVCGVREWRQTGLAPQHTARTRTHAPGNNTTRRTARRARERTRTRRARSVATTDDSGLELYGRHRRFQGLTRDRRTIIISNLNSNVFRKLLFRSFVRACGSVSYTVQLCSFAPLHPPRPSQPLQGTYRYNYLRCTPQPIVEGNCVTSFVSTMKKTYFYFFYFRILPVWIFVTFVENGY